MIHLLLFFGLSRIRFRACGLDQGFPAHLAQSSRWFAPLPARRSQLSRCCAPLASLCFDCFLRFAPSATGGAQLRNPFRQPPSPRFIPPSGSIGALTRCRSHRLFRQPPPRRPFPPLAGTAFRSHWHRFGFGALDLRRPSSEIIIAPVNA